MALKATIFKAKLQISDMDRDYYVEHTLTLARHPSETDERMMVRLLAFAHNASDTLEFTRGLSSDEEADLWQKSLSGEIDLWIEVGLPTEERIRKACNRSERVRVYSYGRRAAPIWWQKQESQLKRFDNLTVYYLAADATEQLAAMAERNMDLSVTIQDGHIWLADGDHNTEITPEIWK
ncbi:YaeQ family protein [Microbulbifer sp. OS29]|uniref:YaeQ family protein n=1 Tax=Microbulbifer okhotskensis TaxID=2926617 RepID=A0A9X2EKI7_9GAMM|nr:YaeQ family protein [Microbulbifer okhotskensis]MCO1333904.1 YaeQ family protein [Microbulbifer okhotskensis]